MNTVAIIDYGMCNLDSVARAVEECGGQPLITGQASDLARAHRIILPGVGAFPDAMGHITHRGFDVALRTYARDRHVPLLGICLGMQLLATTGWEGRETAGLGLIAGEVQRLIPSDPAERVPHIGWNEVHQVRDSVLLDTTLSGKDFYFVHSYHFVCANEHHILARTPYCGEFVSVIGHDTIFGVQFHPEKSQKVGFQVIRNFLNL